ncbi:hypothetical protein [Cupriavidus necator]
MTDDNMSPAAQAVEHQTRCKTAARAATLLEGRAMKAMGIRMDRRCLTERHYTVDQVIRRLHGSGWLLALEAQLDLVPRSPLLVQLQRQFAAT